MPLRWRVRVSCTAHAPLTHSIHHPSPVAPFPRLLPTQISDPNKLKKMNKKQLRLVKRTRINKDGIMELVPAYAK